MPRPSSVCALTPTLCCWLHSPTSAAHHMFNPPLQVWLWKTCWRMNDEWIFAGLYHKTCHLFKSDRLGLHQDVHGKGVCQRYLPSCHSDGASHPWLLLVYRPQGTVLNSCHSVGREYFLVNEVKRKVVPHIVDQLRERWLLHQQHCLIYYFH